MTRSRLSLIAIMAAALGAGIVGGAAAQSVTDVVRAKRFELIDESGKKRATLGIDEAGAAQIVLYDVQGKVTWAAGRIRVQPAAR